LNGRRLGLYVLREGFTGEFLARGFGRGDGNLYDDELGHDVDQPMKLDSGDPKNDQKDLKALASAATEPDHAQRWQSLAAILDIERFVNFMAVEVMICHRDGYCLARNNFRIYHDPARDRLVFLPQGMDQLFGSAKYPLHPKMAGIVAQALWELPETRKLYREQLQSLARQFLVPEKLGREIDEIMARIGPSLTGAERKALDREAAETKGRIGRRAAFLIGQLSAPEPKPVEFKNGMPPLTVWRPEDEATAADMKQKTGPEGVMALQIRARERTIASWHARVMLPPSRYRFTGRAWVAGLKPLPYGKHHGAALRVAGSPAAMSAKTPAWNDLGVEFEVKAGAEMVDLICEFRAGGGEAWFDLSSLKLIQIK
ncbi:MAG TPA: CotH kinase family protein, partial [Verrucomicrobiae bacterium]|nr:CotH kinase family protein [Verrucomicrobiae bacterium]